jgi:hypothetical protein
VGLLSGPKGRRKKRRRRVGFVGGSAVLAKGLCNTEGDLWESTLGGDGTWNNANPYAKAIMGLMKETQSNPASAKKRKRAEEGGARKMH